MRLTLKLILTDPGHRQYGWWLQIFEWQIGVKWVEAVDRNTAEQTRKTQKKIINNFWEVFEFKWFWMIKRCQNISKIMEYHRLGNFWKIADVSLILFWNFRNFNQFFKTKYRNISLLIFPDKQLLNPFIHQHSNIDHRIPQK